MSSTLGHAATELKEAERAVSSTMDKVSLIVFYPRPVIDELDRTLRVVSERPKRSQSVSISMDTMDLSTTCLPSRIATRPPSR